MAHEVNGPVDQHPPGVRGLTLAEQIGTRLDPDLGATRGQLRELAVGQAVEQADSAEIVGAHHAGPGLLMRSSSGWPRRPGEAGGD